MKFFLCCCMPKNWSQPSQTPHWAGSNSSRQHHHSTRERWRKCPSFKNFQAQCLWPKQTGKILMKRKYIHLHLRGTAWRQQQFYIITLLNDLFEMYPLNWKIFCDIVIWDNWPVKWCENALFFRNRLFLPFSIQSRREETHLLLP